MRTERRSWGIPGLLLLVLLLGHSAQTSGFSRTSKLPAGGSPVTSVLPAAQGPAASAAASRGYKEEGSGAELVDGLVGAGSGIGKQRDASPAMMHRNPGGARHDGLAWSLPQSGEQDWYQKTMEHAQSVSHAQGLHQEAIPWSATVMPDSTAAEAEEEHAEHNYLPANMQGIDRFPVHVRRQLQQSRSSYTTIWAISAFSVNPAYTPNGVDPLTCTGCCGAMDAVGPPGKPCSMLYLFLLTS